MDILIFSAEKEADDCWGLKICEKGGKEYRYYSGICRDRDRIERFVAICNINEVSQAHADDVVCDFLSELLLEKL